MLKRVSASQVKDFSLCRRKWFIAYVLKERPSEENESLRIGTEVHTEIEAYLPTGIIRESPWKEHLALAAPLLPPAPIAPTIHVERWIEQPTYKGGPVWVGKIDVLDASAPHVKVWDHKTCRNYKYTLAPEALGTDIQMSAYGWYALTNPAFFAKDREIVELAHTYIRVDGKPDVRPVSAKVSKVTVSETWNKSLDLVSEMETTSDALAWEDVTPNVDACNAYGGCPYREKCGFVTEMDRIVKGGRMGLSLIERLEAEKTGNQAQVSGHDAPASIIPPDAPPRESSPEEAAPKVTKRTRATKAAPVATEQKATTPVDPVVEENMEPNKAPSIVPKVKPATFDLYVDCLPLFGSEEKPVPFEHIMAPIAERVAEEAGVADPRFIKYESKPRLATHLRLELDKLPRVILVSSMHTHADTFLEVTVPYANKYVRALRG